jgi:RHS repeat-associated protein
VDTRTQGNEADVPAQLIRYQFGNHLGSAILELDDTAQIISYEEYYAYGGTSYQAGRSAAEVTLKRYRYTGKERDEESGLYYHGARYYAPWLGRWTSCDPVPYVNRYSYAELNPISLIDPDGRQPVSIDSGTYRKVAGDHVHQVAARTAGPGASRNSAPEFWDARSISTKSPGYNDAGGQRVESGINRAQWGKDINGAPAKTGRVTISSTGQTDVGTAKAAQPSPWFEDVKSFYKLREAGLDPDEALGEVFKSADQLERAGATPERVPGAPRSTPKALKSGQTLSQQNPTRISGEGNLPSAPTKVASAASLEVAKPSPAPALEATVNRPTTGARVRAAAGVGVKVVGAVGVALAAKDVYKSVKNGEYGNAALTAGLTGLSFTPAAPLVVAAGVAMKYHSDPTIEERAFAAGDAVQQATGSAVLGGIASAGSAVGLSVYETGADFAHGVRNFFNDW